MQRLQMTFGQLQQEYLTIVDNITRYFLSGEQHAFDQDNNINLKVKAYCTNQQENFVSIDNIDKFKMLFAERFAAVRDTHFDYIVRPFSRQNLAYLALAKLLESTTGINRFKLLMPTIEYELNEVTGTHLNDPALLLNQFILSEDKNRFIEVLECLEFAEGSEPDFNASATSGDLVKLMHTGLVNNLPQELSDVEREMIINHSREAREYYDAICAKHSAKVAGLSLGAMVMRLVQSLRLGGVGRGSLSQRQAESQKETASFFNQIGVNKPVTLSSARLGTDEVYGTAAQAGIDQFAIWLKTLDNNNEDKLLNSYSGGDSIRQIWYKLRGKDENNKPFREIFCVQVLADALERIGNNNPWLFDVIVSDAASKKASYENASALCATLREKLRAALVSPLYQVTMPLPIAAEIRWLRANIVTQPDAKTKMEALVAAKKPLQGYLNFLRNTKLLFSDFIILDYIWSKNEAVRGEIEVIFTRKMTDIVSATNVFQLLLSNHQLQGALFDKTLNHLGDMIDTTEELAGLMVALNKKLQRTFIRRITPQLLSIFGRNLATCLNYLKRLNIDYFAVILDLLRVNHFSLDELSLLEGHVAGNKILELSRFAKSVKEVLCFIKFNISNLTRLEIIYQHIDKFNDQDNVLALFLVVDDQLKLQLLERLDFNYQMLKQLRKHTSEIVRKRLHEIAQPFPVDDFDDFIERMAYFPASALKNAEISRLIRSPQELISLLKFLQPIPILDGHLQKLLPSILQQVSTLQEARDLLSAHQHFQGVMFHAMRDMLLEMTKTGVEMLDLLQVMHPKTKSKFVMLLIENQALPFKTLDAQGYISLLMLIKDNAHTLQAVTDYCDADVKHMKKITKNKTEFETILATGYATREGKLFSVLGKKMQRYIPDLASQATFEAKLSKNQIKLLRAALSSNTGLLFTQPQDNVMQESNRSYRSVA